jgi:hypothetical protein
MMMLQGSYPATRTAHTYIDCSALFSEALIALVRIGAAFVKKQLSREVDAHRRSDEAYLRMESKSLAAPVHGSFMRVVFIGLHVSLAAMEKSIEKTLTRFQVCQ